MIHGDRQRWRWLAIALLGAALSACAGKASNTGSGSDPGGGVNGGGPGAGGGDPGVIIAKPSCGSGATDAPAQSLAFAQNLIASPAPPGSLTPATAPQIVVIGWDDIESDVGVSFVNSLLGGITNPNGSHGGANMNPNACYAEGYSDPSKYACGNGSLASARGSVTSAGFDIGNHTLDHLESNSTWTGIPDKYKDPNTQSWVQSPDGFGPGVLLDQQTWQTILSVNETELKSLLGVSSILGFRAPRLELNDQGLLALQALGYQYDESIEEIMPDGYINTAIAVDTASQKGFSWFPWPYTLDNGSPGNWVQQATGDKKWVTNFPAGVWEIPVYQVYVPSKNGLGAAIADSMLKSDNPSSCTFPPDTPADQQKHCYLSDGELNPGDTVKEVTSFDFNTFIYSRMTPDQWLAVMKHTFLLRYYGNRAPLTYGAHPIEYTDPYDSFTLEVQANNFGFRDVIKYNTFSQRQQAMRDFVKFIKSDPTFSKDTYFLSAKQLADYMTHPFDKSGAPAAADVVASPDSNALFSRLTWTGRGATIKTVSGNSADLVFNVAAVDAPPVTVTATLKAGELTNVSHIDLKYNTEVPFRIRLVTSDGSLSTTALLAGVGGDRLARVRTKDFFPGPEASAAQVGAARPVDQSYLSHVTGIVFESAATPVTGAKAFNTHIRQITLHGVASNDLCSP